MAMQPRIDVTRSVRFLIAVVLFLTGAQLQAEALEITNVSPSRGPTAGGTIVIISGSGFTAATQVVFGAVAAPAFVIHSDTLIQATSPAGAAGVVDVTVVTAGGNVTLAESFGYGAIPVAFGDSYSTPFNTTLVVSPPGVLSNDDPNNGGGWVIEVANNVTNGALAITPDGGFTYTPTTGFAGTDSFRYRARNATGFSNHGTVTITVAAPLSPLPPSGLYVSEIRGNRVTLRWTPAPFGPTPTAYVIQGGPTPGSVAATIIAPAVPVFTFEAPTGSFYLRVHTQAGGDISGASNEVQIFVNLPIVPAAPGNLLSLGNDTSLTLAWRNSYTQGEPTSLILDVTGSITTSLPLGLTDTFSVAGVPPGTYTVSLRALNAAGSSLPSEPVTLTFPAACTAAPNAPASVLAYKVGSTIHIVWEPPATGPAPTNYVLNVTGSFIGGFATTGRGLSGTVGPGSYTFTVVATNPCGTSAATPPQTVTIP
jgi:hypothetical protein